MELNRCSRCGAFHTNGGDVCPKCANKDNLELSTFKTYIEQNGFQAYNRKRPKDNGQANFQGTKNELFASG